MSQSPFDACLNLTVIPALTVHRRPFPAEALELVTHAATHSNETMKRVDKFKQLLEIQENISGGPDLVSPTRQLIKQGKISKISARGGDHQERYLFLVSGLCYADCYDC